MPGSASDDLLSKSKLLRQRMEARKNPPPPNPVKPRKAPLQHVMDTPEVVKKPKRSPFLTLAYATIATIVFMIPPFLHYVYRMYVEPSNDAIGGLGEALIMMFCFGPPLILSLVVWHYAATMSIIELVSRALKRR